MYEKIFRNVLFPLYEGPVRRRHTVRYLDEYEKSQWLESSALEALRLGKLNALLAHCWARVPFLQHYWRNAGLEPVPLQHTSELSNYPIITKQIITDNFRRMRATNFDGRTLIKSTGGSTGEPFLFEYSQESYARRTAAMWRGYRWCGADLGRRMTYLWAGGTPAPGFRGQKERLYHWVFNRSMLDAFSMTEANLGSYVEKLCSVKPKIIVGYVAPLVHLARWILEKRKATYRPEAVISAAEPLTAPDRKVISDAFGAPVYNTYGCREFMLLAAECQERNGLHVSADHLVIETVNSAGAQIYGQSGDVCVTDLHNFAMPFVRYLNGDRATFGETDCCCGRTLPLLKSVDGRVLDIIRTPDGRILPGEFFVHLMVDFPSVREYQFVQTDRSRLEVRIVPRESFSAADRQLLVRKIAKNAGPEMEIEVRELTGIPVSKSGKRRITVSEVQAVQ